MERSDIPMDEENPAVFCPSCGTKKKLSLRDRAQKAAHSRWHPMPGSRWHAMPVSGHPMPKDKTPYLVLANRTGVRRESNKERSDGALSSQSNKQSDSFSALESRGGSEGTKGILQQRLTLQSAITKVKQRVTQGRGAIVGTQTGGPQKQLAP